MIRPDKMPKNSRVLALPLLLSACLPLPTPALTANPLLSRGKAVYTSGGPAPYLADGTIQSQAFPIAAGAWMALKVGSGPSKVFFTWNAAVNAWSNELTSPGCPVSNPLPVDFDLLISGNSTNGSDGAWAPAASITGNIVAARGHLIDFTGAAWVKLAIRKGTGSLDEIEIFDASKGAEDTWFFAGTSITQLTFKEVAVVPDFGDQVAMAHAGFHPSMVRGGIGCIRSSDMLRNLSKYLAAAGNSHIWAIEMGTNDGWDNGNVNVPSFTKNMQTILDSCKARGIVPILSHPLATNPAKTSGGWQLHPDYVKAVDSLAARNHLIAGPDFYAYFLAHPGELKSDGVHPTATGAASIQRLWAQTASSIYATTAISRGHPVRFEAASRLLSLRAADGRLELSAAAAGMAYVYGPQGRLLGKIPFAGPGMAAESFPTAFPILRFLPAGGASAVAPAR